jgi:tetratricopeptide (TPR) repeat protein
MLQPENPFFYCEVGHQKTLLGDFNEAYQTYQRATTFDDTNLFPLYGMIFCRIKQEQYEDAIGQLEFLAELGDQDAPKPPDHYFLEALVEWRLKGNKTESIRMLDQCLNLHI